MSGVRLKPVDGGSDIILTDGKTTIGRGPLMKVTDKRVSRLHAVVEVNTDQVTVSPIHINPCFYKSAEKDKFVTLPKEQIQVLKHGDQIALLPDQYIYELAIDEVGKEENRRLENQERKEDMNGRTKEIESYADEKNTEKGQKNITKGENARNDTEISSVPVLKSFNGSSEEVKAENFVDSEEEHHDEEDEGEFPINPVLVESQDKARKLPGWMKSASSPTRQKTSDLEDEDEQELPPKRGKRDEDYDEDFVVDELEIDDDDDDDDEEMVKSRKRKPPVQKKKNSPKGKKTKIVARCSSADEEEGIDDDSVEDSDEWTPTQKRTPVKSNTRNRTKVRQRTPKQLSQQKLAEVNEYGSSRVETNVSSASRIELSEEEDETEVLMGQPTRDQEGEGDSDSSDRLPPCPYGLKCYRRNVLHFEEYSHPPGHQLGGVESDKPECPYGIKCLRSNPTHRKEYTHTQPPATARSGRPKRDSTSRKGDSDDDVNAFYEYDDSWLDESESSESYQDDPDDSDWEPEGGGRGSGGAGGDDIDEDVTELVAEARSFLRNKRN